MDEEVSESSPLLSSSLTASSSVILTRSGTRFVLDSLFCIAMVYRYHVLYALSPALVWEKVCSSVQRSSSTFRKVLLSSDFFLFLSDFNCQGVLSFEPLF